MTCLSIIQDAASQLGLRQPQAVFGSTDLTAQILLRFAQQEGDELSRYHDWQALIVGKTFTSVAQVIQTNSVPTDYDRMAKDVEIWNRTKNLRLSGPTPSRTWAQLQSGTTGGSTGWWRLLGNVINIYPAPAAGDTIAYEYLTKNWCHNASSVGQSAFAADSDTALIPERLITLGVVWRFRASRGFPQYAEDMSTYEREKQKAASRDRGTGRIRTETSQSGPRDPIFSGMIDT